MAENVEGFDVPLIKQPPLSPLEKGMVLGTGIAPHATVIVEGAVMVGKSAGLTVIILEAFIVLP